VVVTSSEVYELIEYSHAHPECGGCFALAIKTCIGSGAVTRIEVAEYLGTSLPNVDNYCACTGLPHPVMRKHVMRWLGIKVFEWSEREGQ
jgi:predicted DNA-binding transcriptional regulator AlpA